MSDPTTTGLVRKGSRGKIQNGQAMQHLSSLTLSTTFQNHAAVTAHSAPMKILPQVITATCWQNFFFFDPFCQIFVRRVNNLEEEYVWTHIVVDEPEKKRKKSKKKRERDWLPRVSGGVEYKLLQYRDPVNVSPHSHSALESLESYILLLSGP